MFKKLKNIFYILCCLEILVSCSSIRQPDSVAKPLDYNNEDIVRNEIDRINAMLETEPVRALWRAVLLGNEEILRKSVSNIEALIAKAVEEKNYFEAKKYYISLSSIGRKSSTYSREKIDELASQEIPGFRTNLHAPENISQCMEATVTIWVDRGVKVENGAGYADIIIGSGFFIDERGYIVTNHHVIESMVNPKYEGYSRLYIKLLDEPDEKIPAKVVGYDSVLDLALLKTEITPKYVLNLGSSEDLQLGDKISAIGTPIGLEGTLTSGIISSTERKLFTLGNVFQIDAAVNSGNSGGPLIDENMKVQAIVFAGMPKFQGLNFAIPVEYLKQELNLMYSCGEVVHPWIGAFGHTKRKGKDKIGLEIQYILPGCSASMSGLEPGDVITSIAGNKITSIEDFHFYLMAYEPETVVEIEYLNNSDEKCKKFVYLDNRPSDPARMVLDSDFIENSFIPLFGMKLIPSSTLNKNSYTIDTVIKGSTAEELHFSQFDLITVKSVKIDEVNEYVFAQIYAQRRKKGFLDITMVLNSQLDSPFYF